MDSDATTGMETPEISTQPQTFPNDQQQEPTFHPPITYQAVQPIVPRMSASPEPLTARSDRQLHSPT